jgi:hypothetical protein
VGKLPGNYRRRTGTLPERLGRFQTARGLLPRLRRDYLDAYSIIASGRFTHKQLITLCQRRDPNLDLPLLATSMARHRTLPTTDYTRYGLPQDELPKLSSTLLDFARTIHRSSASATESVEPVDLIGPGSAGPGIDL